MPASAGATETNGPSLCSLDGDEFRRRQIPGRCARRNSQIAASTFPDSRPG
jgi:hypothetical protein